MFLAEMIVYAFLGYLAAGVLFACYFVSFGADKLDEASRGAGFFFRLVIFPGSVALWPYLAWRVGVAGIRTKQAEPDDET